MQTSSERSVQKGIEPVSGPQRYQPNRKYEIQAKDFTSAEQAAPLRVIFGRAFVAGAQVTPIFGFRSVAITQHMGK